MRESIRRVRDCALIPHRDEVRGFVFDVATAKIDEVVL
jgi:carbonic anhydrase